jgi:broad specificity phosphatase PhoE
MKVFVIRHGDKIRVIGDPELTDVGIKQAELTAKYLESQNIKKIFSSPLARTKQTANIIAKHLSLVVTFDDRLKERLNWGDSMEQTFDEFLLEWSRTQKDRNYTPLYGESSQATGDRMEAFLRSLEDVDGNIVIVTHGGAIYDLLLNLYPQEELFAKNSDFSEDNIKECSITEIEVNTNKYSLISLISTKHLMLPVS